MYEEMEPIQFGDLVFKYYSYIVFPYRKYGDIVDLQDQSKKEKHILSEKMKEYICRQIMRCTLILHSYGMAHLDIKPENFIINDDLTISFIDFGHAQRIDSKIESIVGTKRYVAPEINYFKSQDVSSEKADIYSLGATLYAIMNL